MVEVRDGRETARGVFLLTVASGAGQEDGEEVTAAAHDAVGDDAESGREHGRVEGRAVVTHLHATGHLAKRAVLANAVVVLVGAGGGLELRLRGNDVPQSR
ncbi:MAG: hypothetical protein ACYTGZ_09055, partial [Planctomycetota bacterium]